MTEQKKRVDFNAPASLVETADTIAEILDISRTRLLIEALESELEDRIQDENVRRRLRAAYYDGRIEFEAVASVLGREEAVRMRLLRTAVDRDPPAPRVPAEMPSDDEFYAADPSAWASGTDPKNDGSGSPT